MVNSGLEGVVAATTGLSDVDGERGELVIAGYQVGELAARATFEETTWLLWHGERPSARELAAFTAGLAAERELPSATLALLGDCARAGVDAMDALRIAAGTISLISAEATAIMARVPVIVAAFWRLGRGLEPIAPRRDLGHAANYLYMLTGEEPDPERVRGLETYLNTVIDHGLNASTFTARVIISTGSDLASAIVGAIGALKGPLHGGAPGPALDMVFEIGGVRAGTCCAGRSRRGEAHGIRPRVCKVRIAGRVLATAAERMFTRAGTSLHPGPFRGGHGIRLLEEYKPGRRLQITSSSTPRSSCRLGLDVALHINPPSAASALDPQWSKRTNRIIRPQSDMPAARCTGRRSSFPGSFASDSLMLARRFAAGSAPLAPLRWLARDARNQVVFLRMAMTPPAAVAVAIALAGTFVAAGAPRSQEQDAPVAALVERAGRYVEARPVCGGPEAEAHGAGRSPRELLGSRQAQGRSPRSPLHLHELPALSRHLR